MNMTLRLQSKKRERIMVFIEEIVFWAKRENRRWGENRGKNERKERRKWKKTGEKEERKRERRRVERERKRGENGKKKIETAS